ncbi:unnamed protein product [Blepharisma stoltei]|uniref:Uncharacterized protein n=1 Tax=Blepharisma stoltei TaxID=1481888 RepID=A0AAU9IN97_9CILI|nr:unnamed protein product [Blepharisma stoltei]
MKSRYQKQDELHKYSALSEVMLRLKKKGYIDQLQEVLLTIYLNERKEDGIYSDKLKEGVQMIINGLIEEIWKDHTPAPTNFSTPSTPEPARTVQLKVPSNLSRRTPSLGSSSQTPTPIPQKNSVYTLLLRNESEIVSFSEFNTITGPSTFGKAKRELKLEVRNNSPGPAAYKSDPLVVKQKPPQVVMPKSGKRVDFVTNTDIPAPNLYYPSKRFISKR